MGTIFNYKGKKLINNGKFRPKSHRNESFLMISKGKECGCNSQLGPKIALPIILQQQ